MKRKKDWIKVGEIGVDAGICWVGDPCYVLHTSAPKAIGRDWLQFCDLLRSGAGSEGATQFNYDMGHAGLGVVVPTGYGDGTYPVYVQKNEAGRVVAVMVDFDAEEED